jgi:PKD repeat protein
VSGSASNLLLRAEDAPMTSARVAVQRLFLAALFVASVGAGSQAAAQVSTQTVQNPTFSFSTPGQKQITLKACNAFGCSQTITQMITVLNPNPVILSAQVGAVAVEAGQLVNLVGTGRGKPPLTYTWKVTNVSASEVDITGAGAWWDTTGVTAGVYSVALHLQNASGAVDSPLTTVVVLPATAKSFYTVTPCRLLDTRQSSPLGSGSKLTFAVAGITAFACGIPANARALSVNITVVSPTGAGFISVFPGNYPVPVASTINFSAGQTRTNNAILPISSDTSGTLSAQPVVTGNGNVQLVVDVNGYFM